MLPIEVGIGDIKLYYGVLVLYNIHSLTPAATYTEDRVWDIMADSRSFDEAVGEERTKLLNGKSGLVRGLDDLF